MAVRKHYLEGQKFNYFTVLELSEKRDSKVRKEDVEVSVRLWKYQIYPSTRFDRPK